MWVWFLSQEDPLEEGIATHSITLAWKISWTKKPSQLQSTGSQRVEQDGSNLAWMHACIHDLVCRSIFHFKIWFCALAINILLNKMFWCKKGPLRDCIIWMTILFNFKLATKFNSRKQPGEEYKFMNDLCSQNYSAWAFLCFHDFFFPFLWLQRLWIAPLLCQDFYTLSEIFLLCGDGCVVLINCCSKAWSLKWMIVQGSRLPEKGMRS